MRFEYHNASFVEQDRTEASIEAVLDRARILDEAGFSGFSLPDHLWEIGAGGYHDDPFFDCYTLLPAIATATETLELLPLVTCPHYRNPAYLGRILTTLDHLSDGRVVFGVGAGWFEAEYEAYGYEFPPPDVRNQQMRETIELVEAMWTTPSPISYEGDHYAIEDVILEPKPVQEPYPPVLIGGGGEQLTLRAAAEYADRWNVPHADPEVYDRKLSVLRAHCEDVGRNYSDIEKTVAVTTLIRGTTDEAHDAYERIMADTERGPTPDSEFRGAVGTSVDVAATIDAYADLGVECFMLIVPKNDRDTIERFVDEVAPEFV